MYVRLYVQYVRSTHGRCHEAVTVAEAGPCKANPSRHLKHTADVLRPSFYSTCATPSTTSTQHSARGAWHSKQTCFPDM